MSLFCLLHFVLLAHQILLDLVYAVVYIDTEDSPNGSLDFILVYRESIIVVSYIVHYSWCNVVGFCCLIIHKLQCHAHTTKRIPQRNIIHNHPI